MSFKEELIDLYGRGTLKDIEQGPDYSKLCTNNVDNEGFEIERIRIRTFRNELEQQLTGQRLKTQVKISLKLLSKIQEEEDRDDYHKLIKLAYKPSWSPTQQKHFDNAHKVIKGEVYYFLSFTQKNRTPQNPNIVNLDHRYFIEDIFWGQDISQERDVRTQNLLAETIWYFLENNDIKGFFYPIYEGESADVENKLSHNIANTLVFVQLIQGVMFKEKNFCFREYQKVLDSPVCQKRIFVLAEERKKLQQWNPPPDEFVNWHKEIIKDKDALFLKPTPKRDPNTIHENRQKIEKNIVQEIKRIREEMYEKVPD